MVRHGGHRDAGNTRGINLVQQAEETGGGLDEIAFAGGIGENSALVRAEVCAGLEDLGIKLDATANAHPGDKSQPGGGERTISAPDSRVTIRVIPTNEELVVARQTRDLLVQKEGA